MPAREAISERQFRRNLLRWYDGQKRDLPWRRDRDPYRVWISEIMLQQTRVAAVIPYYERFLALFPAIESLAGASEAELLGAWAGLGYYSRARNLQKAAREIAARGGFPATYEELRDLAGIGDYTAAAIASIAFGRKHAAVDGNVLRVLSRYTAEPGEIGAASTRARVREAAERLLDRRRPGEFNQAMMELGATLCLPREPQCLLCPVAEGCQARLQGRQNELPVKARKAAAKWVEREVLIVGRGADILCWQRPADSVRLAGFWELPDRSQLPAARIGRRVGQFVHTIVNTNYRFHVWEAALRRAPAGYRWLPMKNFEKPVIPVSTAARKALLVWKRSEFQARGEPLDKH